MKLLIKNIIMTMIGLFVISTVWGLDFTDGKKCKEHPFLTRLNNYEIFNCTTVEFDALDFPKKGAKLWPEQEEFIRQEGKVHAISYKAKAGSEPVSTLQIVRNFQNAVTKDGGEMMFEITSGNMAGLPASVGRYLAESPGGTSFNACTTMVIQKGGAEHWIYLCASDAAYYMLVTLEKQTMKQEISVKDLEKKINSEGFLTFYINFDTNRSAIKPESAGAIKQIAALLKSAPSLKVSIEGHTDNVGSPDKNKKLSEERAWSVLNAVVSQGVAAERLTALGRGQEFPVADNRSEEGRALNRRVEVVKK